MYPTLSRRRHAASAAGSRRWLKPLLVLGVAGLVLSGCHYYYGDPYYDGPYQGPYQGPYYTGPSVYVAPSFWVGPRYRRGWRGRRYRGPRYRRGWRGRRYRH